MKWALRDERWEILNKIKASSQLPKAKIEYYCSRLSDFQVLNNVAKLENKGLYAFSSFFKNVYPKKLKMHCNQFTYSAFGLLLVVPEGLEPSTYGLENRCSIQLS